MSLSGLAKKWRRRFGAVGGTLGGLAEAVYRTRSFALTPIIVVLLALALIAAALALAGPLAPFVYPAL